MQSDQCAASGVLPMLAVVFGRLLLMETLAATGARERLSEAWGPAGALRAGALYLTAQISID